MKKRALCVFLLTLLGTTPAFCQVLTTANKVKLSPLFPPAQKIHQHFTERWTTPRIVHERSNIRNTSSTNWSGYVAATSLTSPATDSISEVMGRWRVPGISKSQTASTFSSIWVGIDGYSNMTVEQIGTSQDWTNGAPHYYAWVELSPAYPYEILSLPVKKGDLISARVNNEVGTNMYTMTLKNETRNRKVRLSSYQEEALGNSADWIVEAPSDNSGVLPLAKFKKITLTHCHAKINGVFGSINSPHRVYDAITMKTSGNVIKATPSSLFSHGTRFSVTWSHE